MPDAHLQADSIIGQDGNIWTSAGATAGMGIALARVESRHGEALAHRVARELLISRRRPHGQWQFMCMTKTMPLSPDIQYVLEFIS